MYKVDKIKYLYDVINSGHKALDLSMHDLEFYRDHFHDLSQLLNVSGREFYPAFLHANDQYIKVLDIIRHRVSKEEDKAHTSALHDNVVHEFRKHGKL